ncbi:MAG: LPXTG cell wall anchor domain-containing protein [Actinoplanes sp.]
MPADCEADPSGDENAVSCVGPDAAVGAGSELWLTLRITAGAPMGVHPVRVTVSTTSPEGNVVNNTIEALLTIASAAGPPGDTPGDNSHGGGNIIDNLPKTGQSPVGLLVLSMMLVIGGVAARIAARNRKSRG